MKFQISKRNHNFLIKSHIFKWNFRFQMKSKIFNWNVSVVPLGTTPLGAILPVGVPKPRFPHLDIFYFVSKTNRLQNCRQKMRNTISTHIFFDKSRKDPNHDLIVLTEVNCVTCLFVQIILGRTPPLGSIAPCILGRLLGVRVCMLVFWFWPILALCCFLFFLFVFAKLRFYPKTDSYDLLGVMGRVHKGFTLLLWMVWGAQGVSESLSY